MPGFRVLVGPGNRRRPTIDARQETAVYPVNFIPVEFNRQTWSRVAEPLQILQGRGAGKDTRTGLCGISRRTIFARELPHFKPGRQERTTHIADGRPKSLALNSCCQAFCKHRSCGAVESSKGKQSKQSNRTFPRARTLNSRLMVSPL